MQKISLPKEKLRVKFHHKSLLLTIWNWNDPIRNCAYWLCYGPSKIHFSGRRSNMAPISFAPGQTQSLFMLVERIWKSKFWEIWEKKFGGNMVEMFSREWVWKMEPLHTMDLCLLYIDVSLCQPDIPKHNFTSDANVFKCSMS